jgi:tetratricopeptide (TPR) repeat protein
MFFRKNILYTILVSLLISVFACKSDKNNNKIENHKDSISILNIQIRKDPFNASLFSKRAALYWKQQKRDSAINDATIAVRLDSMNEKWTLQLAEYLIRTAKSDKAIDVLQKFLTRKPESVQVLTRIGKYYTILKNYTKAKEYIDKALTIDPQYAYAHFAKAMVLYETNQFEEAKKAFLDVIQYNPDESEAYMMIGLIYQKNNDTLALQYYRTAAQLKGNDPQPYYNMAYLYQEKGDYAKAFDIYNYILRKIDKYYTNAYFNQAFIYMKYLNNYDKAIKYYDSVLLIHPERVDALCNKAFCFEKLGDKITARSLYFKAKSIEPNYELAIEGLNRLENK